LSRCFRATARAFTLIFFAIVSSRDVVLRGLPHLQVGHSPPLFEEASSPNSVSSRISFHINASIR
jgi:hypothetical protein